MFCRRLQPVLIAVFGQDHHHAFFIGGLVKQAHQRVITGIDGQHRIAMHNLALG